MSQENPNKFRPEVIFEAETQRNPERDVINTRGLVFSSIVSGRPDSNPVCEVMDVDASVDKFLKDLETAGKFVAEDRNNKASEKNKKIPRRLLKKIREGAKAEILQIYKSYPAGKDINDLLENISSVRAIIKTTRFLFLNFAKVEDVDIVYEIHGIPPFFH
jgi:hypothetical protein